MIKRVSKLQLIVCCLLLGLATQLLFGFMLRLIDEEHYASQRMEVAAQLGSFRLGLEQQLNSTFYVTRGLAMMIATDPVTHKSQLSKYRDEVELWASETSASLPYLRNLGLSEGYVLRYIYPLEGNEKVIGTDYRKIPGQWPAVRRAIETRQPVVAGPLTLLQGGRGIICRIPLFAKSDGEEEGPFVGMVSMVLDYDALLLSAGVTDAEQLLSIAIRGKDGTGEKGEVFHGSQSVFDEDGVTLSIKFLGGEWYIAAKPVSGWAYGSPYSRMLKWLGYALSVLVAVVTYSAISGIQYRFQQARLFSRELEERVEERTRQLRRAKEDAELANKSKSDFLAVVTHELRTPLNSIIGLTQLVSSMELGQLQGQYLEKVSTSAALLLSLINNILNHSKNESGKDSIKPKAFRLQTIFKKLADVFEVSANEKSIGFSLDISAGLPNYVLGDEEKILQILTNFCGNAIKFTEQGGVRVSVDKVEAQLMEVGSCRLRFSITDTGIGIDQSEQKNLFKPFSQVDKSKARKYQGTGLGLSICKRFVELMGGEVGIESTLGSGSRFWFEVPLQEIDALTETPEPSVSRSVDEIIKSAKKQLAGMRVILAEDNPFNQTLAIALLTKVGVDVKLAENGFDVLALLEESEFHAVLMDIQMPELDGIATTIKIREDERFVDLPIIAMTANAMEEDRQQVLVAGMNDFIAKPIDLELLYSVLGECLTHENTYPQV